MDNIFLDCVGENPWWSIEDNEERKLVINKYHLIKSLYNKLNSNINIV